MNTTKSLEGYANTRRFKPSQQLIQLTKRRMDEADRLLERLEKRAATTQSTAEKRAIEYKIAELKVQYANFAKEMQVENETKIQEQLPREPAHPAEYRPTFSEEKHAAEPRPYAPQEPHCCENAASAYVPSEAKLAEENLKRRLEASHRCDDNEISSGNCSECKRKLNWKQMQLEKMKRLEEYDRQESLKRKYREDEFKGSLATEINQKDYAKTHKIDTLRYRPKSPKVFDDGTCFSKIGAFDVERTRNAQKIKNELNEMMAYQTNEDQRRHLEETYRNRKEKQIDLSTGILPVDKYNPDGSIRKVIIPDKYLQGKTFDNESHTAPTRQSCLEQHNERQHIEQQVIAEDNALEQVRLDRDQQVKKNREEKVRKMEQLTDDACKNRGIQQKEENRRRFGTIRYDQDEQINYGHQYGSTNRRVNPQPDAKQDLVYGEGNFISRIDEADRKRRGKKSYVLPLSEEEKSSKAYYEFQKKHPNKRDLEDWEVSMIRGYIEEKKATVQRAIETRQNQQKYNEELAAFQAEVQARDENVLDEREEAMNTAPEFVRPLF